MNTFFSYQAIDKEGKHRSGIIETANQDQAVKKLQEQGLIITSCVMVPNKGNRNSVPANWFFISCGIIIFLIIFSTSIFFIRMASNSRDDLIKGGHSDKVDKQKFDKVYRAAKTLTASIEGGISYPKLQELNRDFLTEISIAEDSVITDKEKKVIELYRAAYSDYSIGETVWEAIIKYSLDNHWHQHPGKSKLIFEKLKPIIEQFGLVLVSKQTEYDGTMYELPKTELSKIWIAAKEYIDEANVIILNNKVIEDAGAELASPISNRTQESNDEEELFKKAKAENKIQSYKYFLMRFPNGICSVEAQNLLEKRYSEGIKVCSDLIMEAVDYCLRVCSGYSDIRDTSIKSRYLNFNEQVLSMQSEFKAEGILEEIKKTKLKLEEFMRKFIDPPPRYSEAYKKIVELYGVYSQIYALAIQPTGSLATFNNSINTLKSKTISLKSELDAMVNMPLDNNH